MRVFDWIRMGLFWIVLPLGTVFFSGLIRYKFLSVNLAIALVCFTAYKKGPEKGALMGLITGFIEDNMGGIILGPFMLSRSMAGILSTLLYDRMIIWNPVFSMLVIFFMSLIDDAVSYIMFGLFIRPPYELTYFVGTSLLRAVLTAPTGLLIRTSRNEA